MDTCIYIFNPSAIRRIQKIVQLSKSLVNNMNNVGSKFEPCGTPDVTKWTKSPHTYKTAVCLLNTSLEN